MTSHAEDKKESFEDSIPTSSTPPPAYSPPAPPSPPRTPPPDAPTSSPPSPPSPPSPEKPAPVAVSPSPSRNYSRPRPRLTVQPVSSTSITSSTGSSPPQRQPSGAVPLFRDPVSVRPVSFLPPPDGRPREDFSYDAPPVPPPPMAYYNPIAGHQTLATGQNRRTTMYFDQARANRESVMTYDSRHEKQQQQRGGRGDDDDDDDGAKKRGCWQSFALCFACCCCAELMLF